MPDAPGQDHPASPETQRLFFALWPDAATRDKLDRTGAWLHQRWGGRRMHADSLHLTLVFLGTTSTGARDALLPHVDTIRADAFDLRLDCAGYWSHNRIGWLGCCEPPAQLLGLVRQAREALRKAGIPFDAQPFCPHVTLLRNSPDGSSGGVIPNFDPVVWRVSSFALIVSRPAEKGTYYTPLRRWRFRG